MSFRGLSNTNKVLEPSPPASTLRRAESLGDRTAAAKPEYRCPDVVEIRDKRSGKVFQVSRVKSRLGRLRRRVFAWAKTATQLQGGVRMVMQTLTYRGVDDWRPNQIRDYMQTVRKHLGDNLLAYAWIGELQRRGAAHYHVLLVARKGTRIPYPDKAGWWTWGMTNVRAARSVFYVCKYVGKEYQKEGPFPRGMRMFAVWFRGDAVEDLQRWFFRLSSLPGWFIEVIMSLPQEYGGRWARAPGGGWIYEGETYLSPYEFLGPIR